MTDPLGNTKVRLTNKVSGEGGCDSFGGENNIYVEVTEAGTGRLAPVFIVQHIRLIIEWFDCEKNREGCCKPGEKKSEKCEYYEVFGQIDVGKNGKPKISVAPGVLLPSGKPIDDQWTARLPGRGVGVHCGRTGVILFRGVVKAIADPDGVLEAAWRSPNRTINICEDMLDGVGMNVNSGTPTPPANWNSAVGSSEANAMHYWNCCERAISTHEFVTDVW
jgi:hypothetical protein